MTTDTSIKLFESKKVRTHWDETEEKWYFSVIDVVEVINRQSRPKRLLVSDEEKGKAFWH